MRGCLFVLIFAAIFVGGAAWFGAPLLASTVVANALAGSGLHAATSTVTVSSDPPPKLLLGKADRVEIEGQDVDFQTFHAASLDLVLTDVDLLGRTAATISGRIDDAELATAGGAGDPATADVTVDGAADAAKATVIVTEATVDRVVKAAFKEKLGVTVSSTELVAPDTLRISAAGATLSGKLAVDDNGAITLSTPLGAVPILSLDAAFPLRLTSVRIADGSLRLGATLDAEALLGH